MGQFCDNNVPKKFVRFTGMLVVDIDKCQSFMDLSSELQQSSNVSGSNVKPTTPNTKYGSPLFTVILLLVV
jgi:hypothetical protein